MKSRGFNISRLLAIALLITIISLTACLPAVKEESNVIHSPVAEEESDAVVMASGPVLQSEKLRISEPKVSGGDQINLSQNNRAFAFDLYQKLKSEDGNLFL